MPNRLFGKIVTEQMKRTGKQQGDVFGEENQGYVSAIQSGTRVPRSRKGIINLLEALEFPNLTDKFIDWMWALALFGEDPRVYFSEPISHVPPLQETYDLYALPPTTSPEQALVLREDVVYSGNGELEIRMNMPENEVLSMLGPPDNRIKIPSKVRWIYDKYLLYVDFVEQRVSGFALK